MRIPLTDKEFNRRKWHLRFTEWRTQRDRGAYWFSFVSTFINVSGLVFMWGMLKIIWWRLTEEGITRMDILFGVFLIIGGILIEVVKQKIGKRDMKKWKLWEAEQEYRQKNKTLAPFNLDLTNTLKNICKRLGTKDEFRDLNRREDKK